MDILGPSNWWPGETRFEICVGAVLTQNTNWKNVEKAIHNLKEHQLLSPQRMFSIEQGHLAELIRPAGYFRVKAQRLKNFLSFLHINHELNIDSLLNQETPILRETLLQVKGIGPETADSILLYALNRPVFVIDAYTKRIFDRHGLIDYRASYSDIQKFLMDQLPLDYALYNEFHALLVRAGKQWCKKSKPLCSKCPLGSLLRAQA